MEKEKKKVSERMKERRKKTNGRIEKEVGEWKKSRERERVIGIK